jgi:hypothetical protein
MKSAKFGVAEHSKTKIKNVNKNVLLTGAGFSKCFGGFLGTDMHHRLYNIACHKKIKALRHPLRETMNYEKVFGDLLSKGGIADDVKTQVREAVRGLYAELDHAFMRFGLRRETALRIFLEYFKAKDDELGFVFTLNQDLLLERWWKGTPDFSMPGLRRANGQRVFLSGSERMEGANFSRENDKQTNILPSQDGWKKMDLLEECSPLTYIKLHGSMNFVSSIHGKEVMVIGTEKSLQISQEPLLKYGYAPLFRDVLCSGDVRLFVVGYGFQDQNINLVLNEALKSYGLRLFLMDPTRHLVDYVASIDEGLKNEEKLLPGFDRLGQRHLIHSLDGYFPYHLHDDLFPDSQQTDFPQWREIQYRYFECNITP